MPEHDEYGCSWLIAYTNAVALLAYMVGMYAGMYEQRHPAVYYAPEGRP